MQKIGLMVTAYCDTISKTNLLLNLLVQLHKLDKYLIVVASHTPIIIDIQNCADIFFYDHNNVVDNNRKYSQGVAECMLIEQSMLFFDYYQIKTFHKLTYDCELNDTSIFEEWENKNVPFVASGWGGACGCPGLGIDPFCFYTSVDWFKQHIPLYRSIDEMFKVSNMLEICWGTALTEEKRKLCYLYNSSFEMFKDCRCFAKGKNKLNLVNS